MKLYDSKLQELRDFTPLNPGEIGMYVCGPTVQSAPHIGHLRSALVYDLMANWFSNLGFKVTLVRNVTDIDDKVLEKAKEENLDWWELAYKNELVFRAAFQAIGIANPSVEPRATGHIPQMLELIELLVSKGHAYRALDGSADVYFDTASWPSYGELTNQSPADMEGEGDPRKKNPQDFALWKASKLDEPETASWNSSFGKGRPGWHIECSAMSQHFLGQSFDIHGGGLDLRFPHHENELAQSAAAGAKFANYWVHNGLVTIAGQKMSKSLGNFVTAEELLKLAEPKVVRYYLMTAHYRSALDYQPSVLQEAEAALDRLHGFLVRAQRELGVTQFAEAREAPLPEEFTQEMNDDLNIPAALAVIHDTVRQGNTYLDDQQYREAHQARNEVISMLKVLGLAPEQWESDAQHSALDAAISLLIEQRNQARANKDFATADRIRDQLKASGIELSDLAGGTHWSIG